jgi:hypothetical protein
LLAEHRGYRHPNFLPQLSCKQILVWADAHKQRTGQWPTQSSGPIADAPGETWCAVNLALIRGTRGLRGGTTLADLLARRRGHRNIQRLPDLTVEQILVWAEAYHTLYAAWPNYRSGPVGTAGDSWQTIDKALRDGTRGLTGGSSLFRILKEAGKFEGKVTPYRKGSRDSARP